MSLSEDTTAADWAAWEDTVRSSGASPAASAEEAITGRRSVRAFLPTPVPRFVLEHLLTVASRAPSGSNIQPWKVTVVTGAALDRLRGVLEETFLNGGDPEWPYDYYPRRFTEPYLSRRRACGWGLYGALGIGKADVGRMRRQHARNFRFFDAPVGLIVTIDRALEIGSWLDLGMFVQSVMVAARGLGLHTCPQAAFAPYHAQIRAQLGIPEDQVVVCGMAIGLEDTAAPENGFRTDREPLSAFARFIGE
ncbi:MAG TPA: nitroreductase [Azospirillum sp.]